MMSKQHVAMAFVVTSLLIIFVFAYAINLTRF